MTETKTKSTSEPFSLLTSEPSLIDYLSSKLQGQNERVGFILKSGERVEVENISDDPENSFLVSIADVKRYGSEATATWHTHPNHHRNLSMHDYQTFLTWNHLHHFIVGTNGIREYYVEGGDVYVAA